MMGAMLTNRSLMLAGVVLLAFPLHACNTVEGAGEDVESVGDTIDDTADEAGDEMGEAGGEGGSY